MKSDRPFLGHILDSIDAIETYVADGRERFLAERIIQDAVIRNFEVIGEAAGQISDSTREASPLPWTRIVALRNRLIHGYWSVDVLLLWDIVENELPALRTEVVRLLDPGDGV